MQNDENKKFLKSLSEFLSNDSGETLEELKDELKESSIDFNAAEARLEETFSKIIKQKKNEIWEQDRKQMLDARSNFENFKTKQKLPKDRKSTLDEINRINSNFPKLKQASRKYENLSDEDLGKILIELRDLTSKDEPNE